MELHEKIELIQNNKDLSDFIQFLREDLLNNENEWENTNLDSFLNALSAFTYSIENAYKNTGREFPTQPSWKMIGDILYAAKYYE